MENILEPTIDYDFSKLYLGPPSSLQGGAYFTRIMHGNNKQLFIQTPKSLSKQGFIKSGKKIYIDLMFESNDTVFVNWIENLETRCQDLLFSKSEQWFQTALEKSDIESAFTSTLKIFKSGKYYLLRVNVKPNVKIYNETDEIVLMDNVISDNNMISILEIQGIKFTSRNFQMEIELKQSMIVSPDPFLDTCFIKKPLIKTQNINVDPVSSSSEALENFIQESASDLKDAITEREGEGEGEEEGENMNANVMKLEIIEEQKNENTGVDRGLDTGVDTGLDTGVDIGVEVKEEPQEEQFDENVALDFEDLMVKDNEDINEVKEFDPLVNLDDSETIMLKKPNQVYHEIYQKARERAKEAKKAAIEAYLELKNIKKTYMLDDIEEDSDDDDDFSENSYNSSDEDE
jgi:hypothetical protein